MKYLFEFIIFFLNRNWNLGYLYGNSVRYAMSILNCCPSDGDHGNSKCGITAIPR